MLQFYAPWCTFCKQLDPVWHDVASELKSLGSLVNVGKADATAHSGELGEGAEPGWICTVYSLGAQGQHARGYDVLTSCCISV